MLISGSFKIRTMKNSRIIFYALVFMNMLVITSCNDDDNNNPIPAPIADAGIGMMVDLEKLVNLDASSSSGDNISYAWTLKDPNDNVANLDNAATANPSFIATISGVYTAELTITNNGGSNTSTVEIEAINPTYQLADQMGRPAINTVFNFFGDSDTKNAFNQVLPGDGAMNAASFKGIFDALQSYIGLNTDTYTNVLGLDNTTTASVLATDILMSNKSAPATYGPSDLNNIVLGQNVLNGRRLADDVIDVTLILAFGGNDLSAINATQAGLISDNVNANDKNFLTVFPYLAAPH